MNLKLLSFSLLLALVSSCSIPLRTFYEVCTVESNLPTNNLNKFEYSDQSCNISYNFWREGGNAGFEFFNKTDEIIYVDLSTSFFIKNGIAHDYFLNRSFSSTSESAFSMGVLFDKNLPINNSLFTNSSSEITLEKGIVAIPPHSSKYFSQYSISSSIFYDCNHDITPGAGISPIYTFSNIESPISFKNYITYRVGKSQRDIVVDNNFFISSIQFIIEKNLLHWVKKGCPDNQWEEEEVRDPSPKKFYVSYQREYRSTISAPISEYNSNKETDDF